MNHNFKKVFYILKKLLFLNPYSTLFYLLSFFHVLFFHSSRQREEQVLNNLYILFPKANTQQEMVNNYLQFVLLIMYIIFYM